MGVPTIEMAGIMPRQMLAETGLRGLRRWRRQPGDNLSDKTSLKTLAVARITQQIPQRFCSQSAGRP